MSALLGTLALVTLAGIGFTLATSLLSAAAWPLLRRWLARSSPEAGARITLTMAVAPAVVPMVLVGLCLAPGFLGVLGLHADHCVSHSGHPHLCLVHPTSMLTIPFAALLAVSFALLSGVAVRAALRVASTRRVLVELRAGAPRGLAPDVRCVESERPFSITAGLLGGGEIFVSSALADAFEPRHLEAVIEHERAHARRRDGLRRMLAETLSWPHRPSVRRAVLAELELASERTCDEQAARRLGDRLVVAEAILAAERLLAGAPIGNHRSFVGFGGSSVPARVRGLLAAPVAEKRLSPWWLSGTLLVACGLLFEPLHHVTEHVLGLLLGAH